MRTFAWITLGLAACAGGADSDSDTDVDTDVEVVDTAPTEDEMPADPRPVTITVSGALDTTMLFDAPTCTVQGQNFRMFWRNAANAHVFVLIGETIGGYTGLGEVTSAMPNTRAKLQEEAGGNGAAFQTDPALGDSFAMTITHVDGPYEGTRAWGELTINGLHAADGTAVTLLPTTIPVWCDQVN